jgi:hypothetical protein
MDGEGLVHSWAGLQLLEVELLQGMDYRGVERKTLQDGLKGVRVRVRFRVRVRTLLSEEAGGEM